MRKIVTIVGARPQYIKSVLVSREFKNYNDFNEVIINTGQHFDYELSEIFFKELKIPDPKYNLNINSLPHGEMTGKMIIALEKILIKERPNFVLVYGDTNTTLAGALAAAKLHIPIIHIEAGLRSFNMKMPEEINRIITDRLSSVLFCPSKFAVDNLKREGFFEFDAKIKNYGDVMYDVFLFFLEYSRKPSVNIDDDFILCTIHREENTNNLKNLYSIFSALIEISSSFRILLPLHPRTRKYLFRIEHINKKLSKSNIILSKPFSYLEILYLLRKCKLVITDSGGLQKEAYFVHKPSIILRNETEWKELVKSKYAFLAGTEKERIVSVFNDVINKSFKFNRFFYGNGDTSRKIVNYIVNL